ncbi:MAG: DUF4845 domain-containing protein [Rhodoferax sp.]|nr:DUF4845 domain-containing protein [Rhodoferax sp.]
MAVQRKSTQRGISLIGLVYNGVVLACVGLVGAQVLPTYMEYTAVIKAVNKAASEGGAVVEVRSTFDKMAQIDDIRTISSKDLEITKEGEKVVVKFEYQREVHLAGPAWLTMKYAGRSGK